MTPTDEALMQQALVLARSAQGFSSPNPPVGAVIARDGVVVGMGATQPVGGPHAEVQALRMAGDLARGATLYVTLEPHQFQGRTPPCTDAIIAAGIQAVFVAMLDPNPRVQGAGVAQLRTAGLRVELGLGAAAAERLIAPFAHWLATKRPFGIAKIAMSLDGKIATHTGASQWITSAAARTHGHLLRQASGAILVGIETALADDPRLTTRLPDLPPEAIRHPLRVVLDTRGRLPPTARMLDLATPGQTLIATTNQSDPVWRAAMAARGAEILVLPRNAQGRVDLTALWDALGARGVLTVVIEGGSQVLGAAISAGFVQRVWAFVAPIIIGGDGAPGPVGGAGAATLADALRLRWVTVERVGEDVLLAGDVTPPAA